MSKHLSLQDQTTQFRIWATQLIKKDIIKSFAMRFLESYGQVSRKAYEYFRNQSLMFKKIEG